MSESIFTIVSDTIENEKKEKENKKEEEKIKIYRISCNRNFGSLKDEIKLFSTIEKAKTYQLSQFHFYVKKVMENNAFVEMAGKCMDFPLLVNHLFYDGKLQIRQEKDNWNDMKKFVDNMVNGILTYNRSNPQYSTFTNWDVKFVLAEDDLL
jgi:hypothetical protein